MVLFQWQGGAYQAEFGSEPDEAAHYVTGLCVRDYVAGGFRHSANPLHFAKDYYDHYPKVALGHWPPGFYLIQSAWTIPFSPGRISVMLLMAFLTALIATILFSILKKEFSAVHGIFGALLFVVLPLTQRFSMAVMTEIPIALLSLAATISFGKFLDGERKRDAIWFGIFASMAMLTKQSALSLAFVPVFGVLFTRKFYLLKRFSFWSAAIVVFLLCAPWNVLTYKFAREGWEGGAWGWDFTGKAIPFYLRKLYLTLGLGAAFFAFIGLLEKFLPRRNRKPSGIWIAVTGLAIGVIWFHFIVPIGFEDRHLLPALPMVVLFAVAGANAVMGWLRRKRVRVEFGILLLVGPFAFDMRSFHYLELRKGYRGFGSAAEFLLSKSEGKKDIFLIASDARGEGQFISEIAMREKRPDSFIRRASKDMARSSWSGGDYKPKFADEDAVVNYLKTSSIQFVVLDTSLGKNSRKDYHDLLERTIEHAKLPLEKSFPIERGGRQVENAIRVYRVVENSTERR